MSTGIEIYTKTLGIQRSCKLKTGCSVVEVEIFVIGKVVKLIREIDRTLEDVTIHVDHQDASKAVMSCQKLAWIRHGKVNLRGVPGHTNVDGNMESDKFANLRVENGEEARASPLLPIN